MKMGTSDFKLCYGIDVLLADYILLLFLSGEVIFDSCSLSFINVQIK